MTLTLLLDLDDTLLANDDEVTIPAYLNALGMHMHQHADPQTLVAAVMQGTGHMIANRDPRQTLEEVFAADFYRLLGINPESVTDQIATFYRSEYPKLQSFTKPREDAQALAAAAKSAGHTMVLATNPLFPIAAVRERLRWADLPILNSDFSLMTSFEHMHFAKPQAAYLAECLARLGWPEGPVVMVGNDPERDLSAAAALGLASYYVNHSPWETPNPDNLQRGHGDLNELLPWIETVGDDQLAPKVNSPSALSAVLRATPAVFDTWFRVLNNEINWKQRPIEGEWSLTEIICHLRDVEREVHLPRLRSVLNSDTPFIEGIETDSWAIEREYENQDCPAAWESFVQARLEMLDLFDKLSAEDWQRPATHSIFGPVTLQELVRFASRHDRLHVRQVKETGNF